MKTIIRILLYIPFIAMLFFMVENINDGDTLWTILNIISALTFGHLCGFFSDMSKFEIWIKK